MERLKRLLTRWGPEAGLWAVLLTIPLAGALVWGAYLDESAYLAFADARNLAAGRGWGADLALDLRSPLYVLVLWLPARAGISLPWTGLLLSALGWGAAGIALYDGGRVLRRPVMGGVAAAPCDLEPDGRLYARRRGLLGSRLGLYRRCGLVERALGVPGRGPDTAAGHAPRSGHAGHRPPALGRPVDRAAALSLASHRRAGTPPLWVGVGGLDTRGRLALRSWTGRTILGPAAPGHRALCASERAELALVAVDRVRAVQSGIYRSLAQGDCGTDCCGGRRLC